MRVYTYNRSQRLPIRFGGLFYFVDKSWAKVIESSGWKKI